MTIIPVSTVPAVQSYLLTAIQNAALTDSAPSDILVCFGQPATEAPAAIIEVGHGVRRTTVPATFIGGGGVDWLNESYDIDVAVSVAEETVDTDGDPLALSERTWQLVGFVETVIRTDPSLGGLVNLAYPRSVTGGEPVWSENGVGRVCELVISVHVEELN